MSAFPESPKRKRKPVTDEERLSTGFLASGAGLAAAGIGSGMLVQGLLQPQALSDENRSRVQSIIDRDKLPVREIIDYHPGPYYSPGLETVNLPTNQGEIMAHELGHSLNNQSLRKVVGDKWAPKLHSATVYAGQLAPWAGVAAYGLGGKKLRRHAWMAPLGLSAPQLADEALASIRGYSRYGKELGAGPNAKSTLLRAFGTYALHAGLPSAALYLLSRHHDREEGVTDSDEQDEKKVLRLPRKSERRKAASAGMPMDQARQIARAYLGRQ